MKTPEGILKDKVKAFLKERRVASLSAPVKDAVGYYHMYVPSGYGDPALDFTGCYRGQFFAIETKAEGNTPTARQQLIMNRIVAGGGYVSWDHDIDRLRTELGMFFDHMDRRAGQ